MSLIQKIFLTLKTWVFKKKLLKFSSRFLRDPQACFYCPEMCRFSCGVAENLRSDAVTPRGKMSLLHLAERGVTNQQIAGSEAQRLWYLEQCTGCGRCTEYCLHEIDVASNLRQARAKHYFKDLSQKPSVDITEALKTLRQLSGVVLLVEPERKLWWNEHQSLLKTIDDGLHIEGLSAPFFPHQEWAWGLLTHEQSGQIAHALNRCRRIWVESPELAWFLAKALKEDCGILKSEVRLVWQKFFADYVLLEHDADIVFHESYHLTRLLPRLGYSIPMYERGLLLFHHGWNVQDCGGEGYYKHAHSAEAGKMANRFLEIVENEKPSISKMICQSYSCMEHLRKHTQHKISYWLDEINWS